MNLYLVCIVLILSNLISAQDIDYTGGDYNQPNGQDDDGQWVDDGAGQWVDDGTGQWSDDGGDTDKDENFPPPNNDQGVPPPNNIDGIEIKCPEEGESQYFPHPFYPDKFIRCVNNQPISFDCPGGSIWNDELISCVQPQNKLK